MLHLRNKTKGLCEGLGFLAVVGMVVGRGSVSGKACSRVLTVSRGYTRLSSAQGSHFPHIESTPEVQRPDENEGEPTHWRNKRRVRPPGQSRGVLMAERTLLVGLLYLVTRRRCRECCRNRLTFHAIGMFFSLILVQKSSVIVDKGQEKTSTSRCIVGLWC
jgi:hypothetical protein